MRKIFFIFAALIVIGALAQEMSGNDGFIFAVSEEGDSIYFSEDGSTNRTLVDGNSAACKCYQGPNREIINAGFWNSCCWVDPRYTNYPYCTHGCTTGGRK